MQQIADWLEKLGMSEYAQRFAENKIDVSVLRHLTDQDLKDIGVPLGHRRKMLAAIAEHVGTTQAPPQPERPEQTKAQETAERRQVTVMFSDLVGSTALSARMDPEDLRELISAYQKCLAETVQRFGGFVAKYMGDGVLVYFGYPQAHQDDAERAVPAGLKLIAPVSSFRATSPLQTHVGILPPADAVAAAGYRTSERGGEGVGSRDALGDVLYRISLKCHCGDHRRDVHRRFNRPRRGQSVCHVTALDSPAKSCDSCVVINAAGRCGFWFSDYRYDSKKAAWSCPDRPVSFE